MGEVGKDLGSEIKVIPAGSLWGPGIMNTEQGLETELSAQKLLAPENSDRYIMAQTFGKQGLFHLLYLICHNVLPGFHSLCCCNRLTG